MNGEQNVLMTLDYTVTSLWKKYNYIVFTMPKNNILYNTGQNNGKAVPLIDNSNKDSVIITIDGSQVALSRSWLQTGTGYGVDTVMFELQNGGPSTTAGNIPLKVQVPITYPTVNTSVLAGFTLNIYNSEGNVVSAIGDPVLKIIETAVDPTDVVTNLVGPIATGGFSTT